jgi:hypothetical protein
MAGECIAFINRTQQGVDASQRNKSQRGMACFEVRADDNGALAIRMNIADPRSGSLHDSLSMVLALNSSQTSPPCISCLRLIPPYA